MLYTRRDIGKLALTLPAAGLTARLVAQQNNSTWAGVQVGLNVPYSFKSGNYLSTEEIVRRTVQAGASGLELRAQPVELALGSPQALAAAAAAGRGGRRGGGAGEGAAPDAPAPARGEGGGRGGGRGAVVPPSAEQVAAQAAAAAELRRWRLAVPMGNVAAIRRRYNDAGITINIVKWDDIFDFTPEEADYAFAVTKALGANAISCEMPAVANVKADTTRIGRFADNHQIRVGYHNHATVTQAIFEEAFSTARFNGANLDIGHFVSGTKTSPIPFLKQHHDRIVFLHLKDKLATGGSVPHGTGIVPIREALQLIRDNKWNITAMIELDYQIPEGSDALRENAKCLEYAKQCLLG